ncbi:sensor histidine kinase [Flavihumibacter profundi]|uniref:sensor histidine kinase n=1 Tax=Flavihumibacter profundi TaxID=2716883 RepID=UPI001CC38C0B|nr:sensor histidine kinase [Flavihumibacter profundi]MBZ5859593.1 GHKL domain-containing protein [Flavihumibacter profundi]
MKSCFQKLPISVLLLLVIISPAISQDINFTKVVVPDEAATTVITSISQDQSGNIWCSLGGTGIFQFDGVHFKMYMHEDFNPASLANNRVECVYADKKGNIWVGTFGSGLEKFDPVTGTFTHYKHNPQDPSSISGDSVTCILEDRDGLLWVGTIFTGLERMDPASGKFTHYRHQDSDPASLSFDQVRAIYEDKQGVLWIGTGSNVTSNENENKKGGLNRFNKKAGTFTRYLHDESNPQSLIDDRVRAIFEDSKGNFWIGTAGDGLHTMDRKKGVFERHTYDPANPEKLSRPPLVKYFDWADDNITFITEDLKNNIWIGTFGNGLSRYDPATKKITRYTKQKDVPGNFTDSTTWNAYTSRDGVMWMSIWGGGLYKFDPSHQNINQNTSYTKRRVYDFAEQPGSIQWLGTDSGLLRIDKKNNSTQTFTHDPKKPGSISDNEVFMLYRDKKDRLWAGCNGNNGGLNLFNPDKQNFTVYKHDPKISSSLVFDAVICMIEDKQGYFWVGTVNGLDKLDQEKGQFTHYKSFPSDTLIGGKNVVISILEDNQNNLWVGNANAGGLHILDRKSGRFKDYLKGHTVLSILQDSEGKIWAGAEDGLYGYNSGTDNFSLFIDPATGNGFYAIGLAEDNEKNLWITSNNYLYRLNKDRNEVSRFGKEFGIGPAGFSGLKPFKAGDGQLLFGTEHGHFAVYPEKISGNTRPPEIVVTEFRIAGRPAKKDLLSAKEIELDFNQDAITIFFNVVHYTNPGANRAFYMLENYDKGWRPAGLERTAYYYNIPPGKYNFRIKAVSSEGVWSEKSIQMVITPPWWRSWWAYILYGLVIAAIIFSLHRLQKQRVINSERERTRVREMAQSKEIEKAYHELKTTQSQLIQSEKMASLGELTAGIAHEIQNPLNFVNNFSEVNKELLVEMQEAMDKGDIDEAKLIARDVIDNEEKINHHGKRADSIVKGMLQHSRESGNQKEPTDLNKLADEYLRLAYHGLRAKDKSFNATLKTDYDETIGMINIISQDMGRVLLNLINNAFYAVDEKKKQQPTGYEPTVSVTTKKNNNKVEISVQDNGNGISKKVMDKIFQPFFTTKPTGQGTGLGLSLSYDIVKAHSGEIKVNTKEGEGTEFVIQLPV